MKKLLALLLCCLLVIPAALGETAYEESAPLSFEELQIYLSALPAAAREMGELTLMETEDGAVMAVSGLGDMIIANEELTDDTAVLSVELSPEFACPRGLFIGDTLEALLATYPSDNENLEGTYYDAALYITGEKPEIVCGYLLRDGQRVTQVSHVIYHWQEDGVVRCGVEYTLDQGTIIAIRVFGMDDLMDEATALENIADCAELQEMNEYFAYPVSAYGLDLSAFEREDLIFSGMDLTDLTVEGAVELLGSAPVDDWMEDSTGEYRRLRQWDGLSLLFAYDSDKNFLGLDSVIINGDAIEGPRGVRVGDAMDSVILRFLHNDGDTVESGILLYGDGITAPFGIVAYSENTATVTYTLQLDEKNVLWQMTFANDTGLMQEMRFLIR